ncbi:MAG: bifunctional protein FolD [Planctomycetaceae bacterium]|nr:MAG: bifunctional protein FolD [Planctomycetaceae bacterium]
MSARILDGRALASRIQQELSQQVEAFRQCTGKVPHLAAILVGDDPASAVYVKNKERACRQVGMLSTVHRLPAHLTPSRLLELIATLNQDPEVHGILIQLPLPTAFDPQSMLDAVHPFKDVDCFHPENVGRLMQGRPRFEPCTPQGVLALLREAGCDFRGAHAVILGRSDIVGKPLAMMLAQRGVDATVTLCHSRTCHLADFTRQAHILVAAVGQPEFVQPEMVRPGAVVIDVGINRIRDKLVGDVAYEKVREIASAITPVPGGVGPMTITMLLRNTLHAAKLCVGLQSSTL